MEFQINPYNLIIAFGTFQAFIFGSILFWKSSFKEAHKYLGICVLFLSCYLLWVLKDSFGINEIFPKAKHIPLLFLWGIGPAFYTYLRFYFKKPLSSNQVKWIFSPLIIEFVYYNSKTFIGWLNGWEFQEMSKFEQNWVLQVLPIEHFIGLLSMAIYLIMGMCILRNQQKTIVPKKIFYILFFFSIVWLIWLPYTIVDSIYYNFNLPVSKFYLFYILFTALTYGIGFIGFRLNVQEINIRKTKNSPELQELSKIIEEKMLKEKYYLNPELNLEYFSESIDIKPNKVSTVLNSIKDLSFRDYVNSFRVTEFKIRIETYDFHNHTILSLAYDCGFNSKASFQRVFKKHTGFTPSEYLKKLNNESQNTK